MGTPHRRKATDSKHIEKMMKERNLSFKEMGALLGFSGSAVRQWLNGTRRTPYWTTLALRALEGKKAANNNPSPRQKVVILMLDANSEDEKIISSLITTLKINAYEIKGRS